VVASMAVAVSTVVDTADIAKPYRHFQRCDRRRSAADFFSALQT